MMDFGKLQADAVKDIYKKSIRGFKPDYMICAREGDVVPILYKSFVVFFVPAQLCLVKPFNERAGYNWTKLMDSTAESCELKDEGNIKEIDSQQIKILKSANGKDVAVDVKLVKMFGSGVKFYSPAKTGNELIRVMGTDICIGLLCPYRLKCSH